jgi:hypothetical protein
LVIENYYSTNTSFILGIWICIWWASPVEHYSDSEAFYHFNFTVKIKKRRSADWQLRCTSLRSEPYVR